MLSEALDFPTSGNNGSAALLVGSLLFLISAVFVVAGAVLPALLLVVLVLQVAVRGYYVRVLRVTAAERNPVAPSFGDVTGLVRDGVIAVAIAVAYLLPTVVLFLFAAGGNLASAVQNPLQLRDPATIAAAETVGSLAALLGLFSALAAVYLVPGAVTLYAHEHRVRSAFDIRRVLAGTVSEDYAVGWVLTLVLQALLLPIVALLYSLIVGVFLHFFLGVAVRYVWGTSLGNALDIEPPAVDREGITPSTGMDSAPNPVEVAPSSDQSAPDHEQPPVTPSNRAGPVADGSPAASGSGEAAGDPPRTTSERGRDAESSSGVSEADDEVPSEETSADDEATPPAGGDDVEGPNSTDSDRSTDRSTAERSTDPMADESDS